MSRLFSFLGLMIAMAIGMYLYSRQVKAIEPGVEGSAEEAPMIVGVKNDLIAIGNAERGFMASQGHYASLDELTSGNYLTIKGERPPYVYDVEMAGGTFRATATRTTKGRPAQLWVSDDMQVRASD